MSNTDFALAVEDLTVSFDGFKAIDDPHAVHRQERAARDHRPQRRRQDHAARPDLRQDPRQRGSIKFKNTELTKMAEHKRVRLGIGRKFQTPSIYENLSVFQNLEVSYPSGRSVFGALAFKCTTR
jgi:urea transport system ATP-binding protein